MSTAGIIEFLTELNETDSLAVLRAAHSQKSTLLFKIDAYPKPITAFIENFMGKRVILSRELCDLKIPTDTEVSIKFDVGLEIYFIKTFFKYYLNCYYFDMSSKVIHLKRRREPRFLIPKRWTQSAGILINFPKLDVVKSTILDISLSGIRFEIIADKKLQSMLNFNRDDIIKIKFQIYKRAEITSTAIVRFILNKPLKSIVIGLEFAEMLDVQQERVANIIEDISLFSATTKN